MTNRSNRTRTRTFASLAAGAAAVAGLALAPALPAAAAGTGYIGVSNTCGTAISVSVQRNGIEITSDTIPAGGYEDYYVAAGGGYSVVTSPGGTHSMYVLEDRVYGFHAC